MDFDNIFNYTRDLAANNNRAWFHENHKRYETAMADFTELCDLVKLKIIENSEDLGRQIMLTKPRAFMYRVPRDMRYSREKEPYNPSFRAYFSPCKKEFLPLAYYLYIDYNKAYIGTGVWPWTREQLSQMRDYVAKNYEELDELKRSTGASFDPPELKRVPRGYDEDHPAADWLRHKTFFAQYDYKKREMSSFNAFLNATGRVVKRFEPLRLYFSAAFEDAPYDDEDSDYLYL